VAKIDVAALVDGFVTAVSEDAPERRRGNMFRPIDPCALKRKIFVGSIYQRAAEVIAVGMFSDAAVHTGIFGIIKALVALAVEISPGDKKFNAVFESIAVRDAAAVGIEAAIRSGDFRAVHVGAFARDDIDHREKRI